MKSSSTSRRRGALHRLPSSTYRLQLNRDFTLADAARIVPYLHHLGITDLYLSPIFAARPGSPHGYDVTDHSRINPEIGTEEDMLELGRVLGEHGMSTIIDVVPNHMCVSHASNRWWWDVLENGPSSQYASHFDIDWNPPKEELRNKTSLPFLGDQFGKVLEEKQIQVRDEEGTFLVHYWDSVYPVAPRSWRHILKPTLSQLSANFEGSHPDLIELESILTGLNHLPPRTETREERLRERRREKEVLRQRLRDLIARSPEVKAAVAGSLEAINGRKGIGDSFDQLEALLAGQAYRLSYWRVAADEINYRRFFDINELAAIRVEDPEVFQAVHALPLDLVRRGLVKGMRVDHPDGLFDPLQYFEDLQSACLRALAEGGQESAGQSFYVAAEKILAGDEELRPWAIQGTTGYGVLNLINGLFIDTQKQETFHRLYRGLTGWTRAYEDLLYDCKGLILQVSMSSELNVLARRLDRISEQHRYSRDFTLESLRDALREVIICFPIYRTYMREGAESLDSEDTRHVEAAISVAKRRNPAVSESVFDFIQDILLLRDPPGLTDEQRSERRIFVMRLQQFTGPVMAKGLEDTAFYRYFPLASANEVGGEADAFGVSENVFHRKNLVRRRRWPHAMAASSTHDSKRSEDVRARINVLSEIPAEWFRMARRFRELNRDHRTRLGRIEAPTANDEYLLYQTLIGTWPFEEPDEAGRTAYAERIEQYMQKALREAKLHTSWVSPNAPFEEAVRVFIERILDAGPDNRFLREFKTFQSRIARAAVFNSLSQTVLKGACPGVPDYYQGTELFDFSLVDPDNRRPVDYGLRERLLRELDEAAGRPAEELTRELLARPADGRIKLSVTSRLLRFRRENPAVFAEGSYLPLRATGVRRRHVISFSRTTPERGVIVIAGRFFHTLLEVADPPTGPKVWGDTALPLRSGLAGDCFRDLLTGISVRAETSGDRKTIPIAEAFRLLPVAVLVPEPS